MTVDWGLVVRLAGPLLGAAVGWWLHRISERRSKLVVYYGHVGAFQLRDPPGPMVHTHEVVIRNVGGRAATNVRVSHGFLPDFNVLPPVPHAVVEVPGGGRDIVIERLVPREQVTIAYLYYPPLTFRDVTTGVRSDDGFAQVVPVLLARQYPRWVNYAARALLLIGVVAVLYVLVAGSLAAWARLMR